MIRIETSPDPVGYRTLRALDDQRRPLAMAVEHTRGEGSFWHIAVVFVPTGVTDRSWPPFPELPTIESATEWVRFLGELVERASRVVWCPNDTRQTAHDAAGHGVAVVE
ncbi:hypothetical protein QEH38_gp56 [Mycobacterium phage LilSpotty]|uniref:Uncharacterized protein n=1 Tax=Mycobacterium phage LilSpotty TaxID=2588512 RepID=A0A4Y6EM53_9CAUD|nr:hypothetical protein QEH38_gp56 [Mycobacterium phage LilSpotty]QDF19788.1 hypothetical protein SEA_LILSPOTTY_56 [Mycobacterium phage LilSpotty]